MESNFNDSAFLNGKTVKIPQFPVRAVCGEIQWTANLWRPAVIVPVSVLSEYTGDVPSRPYVKACRNAIKFLVS